MTSILLSDDLSDLARIYFTIISLR
uniref:Uncharacterized protein n=1 Tax=Anguilla anguilla TaxID=7936 RepID=A0A0E9XCA5_ANGAN